jgi:Ras-related protein Rab-21
VFDITDVDSFTRVKSWVKELRQMAGAQLAPGGWYENLTFRMAGKDIALVLAGNKVDMERSRQVSQEESEAYAASIGAALFGTSAKLNRGVEQAFLAIARSACAWLQLCT